MPRRPRNQPAQFPTMLQRHLHSIRRLKSALHRKDGYIRYQKRTIRHLDDTIQTLESRIQQRDDEDKLDLELRHRVLSFTFEERSRAFKNVEKNLSGSWWMGTMNNKRYPTSTLRGTEIGRAMQVSFDIFVFYFKY